MEPDIPIGIQVMPSWQKSVKTQLYSSVTNTPIWDTALKCVTPTCYLDWFLNALLAQTDVTKMFFYISCGEQWVGGEEWTGEKQRRAVSGHGLL